MNAAAVYDFRVNASEVDISRYKAFLRMWCKKYCLQLERGEATGYEHYQGRLSLIKKKRKVELMKLFEGAGVPVPNYLEPTSSPVYLKGDNFYVMKEDTRIDGPWTDKDEEKYIPKQFREKDLKKWQVKVVEDSKVFNDRLVNVIYDPVGCNGKSFLSSYCSLFLSGITVPPVNDAKELMAVMCDICMGKEERKPNPVFIDMPRSQDQSRLYGVYSAIEQIKNGLLYDLRYKYKEWWIDSPAIWVFMNTMPDLSSLSKDRWIIWEIKDNDLVRKNL